MLISQLIQSLHAELARNGDAQVRLRVVVPWRGSRYAIDGDLQVGADRFDRHQEDNTLTVYAAAHPDGLPHFIQEAACSSSH